MTHKTAKKLKVADIIAVLQSDKINGNMAAAARALGVSRETVYRYARNNPEIESAITQARQTMCDNAESALHAAILEKQGWAVCFALKCLGKDRGYIERSEVVGTHTAININYDELTDDELTRIAAGEHPARVLADRRR